MDLLLNSHMFICISCKYLFLRFVQYKTYVTCQKPMQATGIPVRCWKPIVALTKLNRKNTLKPKNHGISKMVVWRSQKSVIQSQTPPYKGPMILRKITPRKINMEPNNGGMEDDFPFQLGEILGSMWILRGCNCKSYGCRKLLQPNCAMVQGWPFREP